MKDRIVNLLQSSGPMLPVEIGSKLGMDSFMAKAYLVELIEDGTVHASKEKLAESHMYYLSGQEKQVQDKINSIKQAHAKKPTNYAPAPSNVSPEVQAKREAFAQRLAKIEAEEAKRRAQPRAPLPQAPRPIQTQPMRAPPPRSVPIERIPVARPPISPKPAPEPLREAEYKPEVERTFLDTAMDWIKMEGTEIIEEISSKKNEMELIVNVYTDFGKVNFYMKIKNKKSITEADLMAVYAGAMENKCPAVLVTNGKLAKSAEAFLDEKGWIVKVKHL
jgi:hypothetical protein